MMRRRLTAFLAILALTSAVLFGDIRWGGGGLTKSAADGLYCKLVGCTMTGALLHPNGTATAPSDSFTNSTGSGSFFDGVRFRLGGGNGISSLFDGKAATSDVAPGTLQLAAQSAWAQAATNTTGGNITVTAGIGQRFTTSISNLLGSVTITTTVDGASVALVSGTDFTLGTDNTAPQLAVTAANFCTAFNANGTLSAKASCTAVAANAFITKLDPTTTITLATSGSGRMTVTQGTDGTVILPVFSVIGQTMSGTNIAAPATATITGPLGTGTATGSALSIRVGTPRGSGSSVHIANSVLLMQDFGLANVQRATVLNQSGAYLEPKGNTFFVAGDFTSTGNTNLQTITGLSWTMPANHAMNMPFRCDLVYSIATAAVAVDFGIQDVTVAPTNINAMAEMFTSATAVTAANLPTLASTTATSIVSATPSAITTKWNAHIEGFIEQPSNAAESVINIMVKTANASDLPTVYRGSRCTVGF